MRTPSVINLVIFLLSWNISISQDNDAIESAGTQADIVTSQTKRKINFFIISKPQKGKLDLASRFNIFRTKIKGLFRRKKFVAIVARNTAHAGRKMERKLLKRNAEIGTLWFDSHGMYKKGYSLFFIGSDEISYYTLKDSFVSQPFHRIAKYSGTESKIVIGSCYGGATYYRSSIDYSDTTRMNGDSLMISLGKIFNSSSVFGSESWVMTKPGLFLKRAAVAGFPRRKLFRDVCYEPAWQTVGKWNRYNARTDSFETINPVTLDMYGNLLVRKSDFTRKKEVRKEIEKNLARLKPGLYK